jgi:prepilin-type N-terminal cleavage/methylation domain-containing protein
MLTPKTAPHQRRGNRAGFSLIELLVVTMILTVVMTSVMSIFIQQQRFYSGSAAIMETRSATRDAAYVLQSELRALSPKSGDILSMGTGFLEFRSQTGATVVCTIDVSGTVLGVPPLDVATEAALTSWLTPPAVGDTLLIFDAGGPGSGDDTWRIYTLTSAPTGGGSCPNTTGLTTTSAEATNGWTLRVDHALTATTLVGAPIRLMRHARYELYQETSGSWYLGYYDCVSSRTPRCTSLQPVAGPYVAPNISGTGGIVFTFRDSTGAVTTNPSLVRQVGVVARAQPAIDIRIAGYKSGMIVDSMFTTIAPRN